MRYVTRFDDNSKEFTKDSDYNYVFIRAQQNYFNDRLGLKGHVFLNEILDALGLSRVRSGQTSGWVDAPGVFINILIEENVWNSYLTLVFNVQDNILECLPE